MIISRLRSLKVAYQKLGKTDEELRTSRRLAEAYFNVGSFTLAMQECEAVLAAEPGAPEILAMLGEIEAKLPRWDQAQARRSEKWTLVTARMPTVDGGLLEIGGRNSGKPHRRVTPEDLEQGNEQLAKFLIVQQMFSEDEVQSGLAELKETNRSANNHSRASLLDRLCKGTKRKMEAVLSALIDRTKFAYVPLEYYDIDRQIARMLPDELTLGRLFVPFDLDQPHDHGRVLQSVRRRRPRSGPAIARLHRDVVSGEAGRRSSRRLQDIYRLESRGLSVRHEKQIFRRTHRRCPDRGRPAPAQPARRSDRDPEEARRPAAQDSDRQAIRHRPGHGHSAWAVA